MSKIKEKGKKLNEAHKKFWSDFKAFIMRGSVLDLAVGVVIGGAFNAIVTARSPTSYSAFAPGRFQVA